MIKYKMEHYYKNEDGWFNYQDFYRNVVTLLPQDANIVEVGAWKGSSTAYLGVEIFNSGKNVTLNVVDTWEGSPNHSEIVKTDDIYAKYLENMKPLDGKVNYKSLKMTSVEASKLFEDESLDFVFIDANHSFESVCEDIDAWLPKLKYGGLISGHDYDPNHQGVIDAVNLKFNGHDNYYTIGYVWYTYKTKYDA